MKIKRKRYYMNNRIQKIMLKITALIYVLFPILGMCSGYIICKYYWKPYSNASTGLLLISIYLLIYLAFIYMNLVKSYSGIYNNKLDTKYYIIKFVSLFIGSIILFSDTFVVVLIFSKGGYSGIDLSSQLSIYVDLLLFTLQNIVFQNIIDITPTNVYSKIAVISEVIYFTVFVTIVLFNIINIRKRVDSK